jgi:hypothetical protein
LVGYLDILQQKELTKLKFMALFKLHNYADIKALADRFFRFSSVEKVFLGDFIAFTIIDAANINSSITEATFIGHYTGAQPLKVWAIRFEADDEGNLIEV